MKREKGGVSVKEAIGHGAVFSQSKHRQREKRQKPVTNASQDRPVIYFPPNAQKKKRTHISLSPIIIVKRGERGKKNDKTKGNKKKRVKRQSENWERKKK